jgi:hypothetical protein
VSRVATALSPSRGQLAMARGPTLAAGGDGGRRGRRRRRLRGNPGLALSTLPPLGPVLAVGPLVGGLVGAGVGAGVGAALGSLAEVPEQDRGELIDALRRGGTIVSVSGDGSTVERAAAVLRRYPAVAEGLRIYRHQAAA